jgi:hypothetical protein
MSVPGKDCQTPTDNTDAATTSRNQNDQQGPRGKLPLDQGDCSQSQSAGKEDEKSNLSSQT